MVRRVVVRRPMVQRSVVFGMVARIDSAVVVRMVAGIQTVFVPVRVAACMVVTQPAIPLGHSVAIAEGAVASSEPMSARMKASGYAAAAMFERTMVVIAEMAMIDDGDAV